MYSKICKKSRFFDFQCCFFTTYHDFDFDIWLLMPFSLFSHGGHFDIKSFRFIQNFVRRCILTFSWANMISYSAHALIDTSLVDTFYLFDKIFGVYFFIIWIICFKISTLSLVVSFNKSYQLRHVYCRSSPQIIEMHDIEKISLLNGTTD